MSDYQAADLQERVRARKAATADEAAKVHSAPVHPIVQLGGQLGNAHVARMISQQQSSSLQRAAEEDELQMKHDAAIQRVEEEDEEVQAKHDSSLQRAAEEDEAEPIQGKHDPSLQRAAEEDELQMSHDDPLQRRASQTIGLEGGPVGDSMAGEINAARGGGSALHEGVRSQVEDALGADLSGVRVHQDAQADNLNRSMTAKAFTTGSDIFLRSDANPGDTSLMAHELTHVVQQSSGSVGTSGGMAVSPAGDSHEQEADRVAESITSGAAQRQREETLAG